MSSPPASTQQTGELVEKDLSPSFAQKFFFFSPYSAPGRAAGPLFKTSSSSNAHSAPTESDLYAARKCWLQKNFSTFSLMNKTKGGGGGDEKWDFITSAEKDILSISYIFAKNAVQIPISFCMRLKSICILGEFSTFFSLPKTDKHKEGKKLLSFGQHSIGVGSHFRPSETATATERKREESGRGSYCWNGQSLNLLNGWAHCCFSTPPTPPLVVPKKATVETLFWVYLSVNIGEKGSSARLLYFDQKSTTFYLVLKKC